MSLGVASFHVTRTTHLDLWNHVNKGFPGIHVVLKHEKTRYRYRAFISCISSFCKSLRKQLRKLLPKFHCHILTRPSHLEIPLCRFAAFLEIRHRMLNFPIARVLKSLLPFQTTDWFGCTRPMGRTRVSVRPKIFPGISVYTCSLQMLMLPLADTLHTRPMYVHTLLHVRQSTTRRLVQRESLEKGKKRGSCQGPRDLMSPTELRKL